MPALDVFALDGRTILVAGASRGIGLAIARALAEAGARTILAARSTSDLDREADRLVGAGHAAEARRLDVTSRSSIEDLAASLPPLDGLVNVAGMNIRKAFTAYRPEEYERLMQTNLHGLVTLTQLVGERMVREGRGGKVVFITSLNAVVGVPYLSVYAMTKSALWGLTRALAAEWGRHAIQVNAIAPGFILTDLNRQMWQDPELQAWLRGSQANPRLGTPEDVAPLAIFLCSRASDYVTGQMVAVDGGFQSTRIWPFEPAAS